MNNIIEYVSNYTHLSQRGANYIGVCPFPRDKKPGVHFSINKEKQAFFCFSCKRGGDLDTFKNEFMKDARK